MSLCWRIAHSSRRALSSSSVARALIRLPRLSHKCSMGFKSGVAGQAKPSILFC
ncbi:unnamed protein product [Nezara viridula]|uniref:Uncharacterized protein n=1 Tax=Nezara viridula TaxID=85310 RepID=A0A9P0E9T4_NEZVI|nr:unnamed protein product [Nezara viridula]